MSIQLIVVDDHIKVHQGIAAIIDAFDDLEIIGHASNGQEAISLINEQIPDLVLMDLGLPDIDGQTVVAMIRQNPDVQHIKVLAFTAWPEERAAAMAQAYGCDGVINKPIDTRQFAGQVAAYLGAQEETPEA